MVFCIIGVGLGRLQSSARANHHSDPVSRTVQNAVFPAANAVGSSVSWTGDFFIGLQQAARIKKENERLHNAIAAMQMYEVDLADARVQIEQLRQELNLEPIPGREHIFGSIIDYAPFENVITLDIGSKDGVKPLLPVISAQGLVGRVDSVDDRTCKVQLITDPSLKIGARVQREIPVPGLVHGYTANQLTLEVIDRSIIEVGDPVVTSGYSSLIPPGLIIGEVAEIPKADEFNVRLIKVFPKLRLALNQEVAVLK